MALQTTYGPLFTIPETPGNVFVPAGSNVINAANQSIQYIGYLNMDGGSAVGSKSLSSAGGKIYWNTSTVTFANAGTTLRVGVQDISGSAPAQGDGTFDVYRDLVGGTDTIGTTAAQVTAMAAGPGKTLTHGQLIAIAFTLISRGGSDSINFRSWSPATTTGANQIPATMTNASGSFVRSNGVPDAVIEFDDGTLGWLTGSFTLSAQNSVAYNLNTGTADEYGNLIIPRFKLRASAMFGILSPASSSANFEMCLYSDPLGSPTLIEAISITAAQLGSSTAFGAGSIPFLTERILSPGTVYAITFRPTTANNITSYYHDVADSRFWKLNTLGDDCYAINRLNNSGAFSDYNGGTPKTRRMWLSLIADQFDDGAGGGGGGGMLQGNFRGNFQ